MINPFCYYKQNLKNKIVHDNIDDYLPRILPLDRSHTGIFELCSMTSFSPRTTQLHHTTLLPIKDEKLLNKRLIKLIKLIANR